MLINNLHLRITACFERSRLRTSFYGAAARISQLCVRESDRNARALTDNTLKGKDSDSRTARDN
jgi:hypothetical protein